MTAIAVLYCPLLSFPDLSYTLWLSRRTNPLPCVVGPFKTVASSLVRRDALSQSPMPDRERSSFSGVFHSIADSGAV